MSTKSAVGAAADDGVLEGGIETAESRSLEKAGGAFTTASDGEIPTDEELQTLRRVPDAIPWSIYTVAFIELCERFSYYGITAVFTNFIQCKLVQCRGPVQLARINTHRSRASSSWVDNWRGFWKWPSWSARPRPAYLHGTHHFQRILAIHDASVRRLGSRQLPRSLQDHCLCSHH